MHIHRTMVNADMDVRIQHYVNGPNQLIADRLASITNVRL